MLPKFMLSAALLGTGRDRPAYAIVRNAGPPRTTATASEIGLGPMVGRI